MTSAAITSLVKLQDRLSAGDRKFALSLVEQFNQRASLSPRQWEWVGKLVERAVEAQKRAANPEPKVEAKRLFDLFATAGERLKTPRLTFEVPSVGRVVISPAKATSPNAGQLYVKVDGAYAGKVAPTGDFRPSFDFRSHATSVATLITTLSQDPLKATQTYGKSTGNCCFCAKVLTDSRSIAVGYGPVCADNWGLPWGE